MDNQIFKEGQCLRSNLNDDYIVSEIKDINGICSYVLLSLKSQVATILSHATIVRSGWKPLDQMVSSKDIYQRKKDIDKARQLIQEIKEQDAAKKKKAEAHILKSPEFAELETYKSGECKQILAVRNIRILLKQHFNGVTFSVRVRNYKSIHVRWNDGPIEKKVDALLDHFKEGCFNEVNNIYEYSDEPFNDVFGGILYIFLNRDFSDELISDVITMLSHEYDDVITHEHTAEAYRRGKLKTVHKDKFVNGLQDEIYQRAVQLDKYLK